MISEKQAIQWLSNEIKNIPNILIDEKISEDIERVPPLCDIALYRYNAVVGNANGYYDKFPLVLVVRPLEHHFFGFNLHYLDHDTRLKIINVIRNLQIKSMGSKKLLFSRLYPFLDGLVKMGIYNHAYKNYVYKAIDSKFVVIKPEYYEMVSSLPIARLKENNNEQFN